MEEIEIKASRYNESYDCAINSLKESDYKSAKSFFKQAAGVAMELSSLKSGSEKAYVLKKAKTLYEIANLLS